MGLIDKFRGQGKIIMLAFGILMALFVSLSGFLASFFPKLELIKPSYFILFMALFLFGYMAWKLTSGSFSLSRGELFVFLLILAGVAFVVYFLFRGVGPTNFSTVWAELPTPDVLHNIQSVIGLG